MRPSCDRTSRGSGTRPRSARAGWPCRCSRPDRCGCPGARRRRGCWGRGGAARWSWQGLDLAEAAVVIGGVVEHLGRVAAGDDAARATVARAGRGHRVFAVVAARLGAHQAFAVLEGGAVLAVGEWPGALDRSEEHTSELQS